MTTPDWPQTARARLVAELRDAGDIISAAVSRAMEAVPRHKFVPGVAIAEAYANQPVIIKRDAEGNGLSSASQPSIMATMLEQLDIQPGHRVLEIGAGTGYNAALLRTLVGPHGNVTTVEIDPHLANRAREALTANGYGDVQVVTGDGAVGHKASAPFDRVIVTAGAWDLPPAWWKQLTKGGRLVVPLRWRGQTRSVAFDHHGAYMVSRSLALCGFIPMQGGDSDSALRLGDGTVTLHYDGDQPIDLEGITGVLDQPRHETWSGIIVESHDSLEELWLWLTTVEPGTCRITTQPSAVDSGLATPAIPDRTPAVVEGASLAYLVVRPNLDADGGPGRRWELGAVGHGNDNLTDRFADQILSWDLNRNTTPVITAYPTGTSDDHLSGATAIRKRHIRMIFSS
jgi:protein-L-isoaspartate(D-aspartate) O-methyltransferase